MNCSDTVTLLEYRAPSQQWTEFEGTIPKTTETSFTLVFPIAGDRTLLGLKRRGFGRGLINGFGGKVEEGESIEEAAVRELEEECGILVTVSQLEPRGQLVIVRPNKITPPVVAQLFVYTCRTWSGSPVQSDEMQPEWFGINSLPFEQMWPEARLYLPHLLKGAQDTCITGKFQYREDSTTALDGWRLEMLSRVEKERTSQGKNKTCFD